ncbi:DHA2 family efflux MFS transporter permease subunit [Streptomyces fuscichromogenes]|uniref:MFS transporter n=1 Tax=Streptomyces fuscichromogenes TaxID=1324013 RepID=A0A917XQ81_9ACTN|nr:DHA2 family efflux MFS transporter permease subunit [Streptomyces fuscichromogenes]GGN46502.1 MFS transporter [Streptomyces fuscichromogenes]
MSRWRSNPWVVLTTLALGFYMTLLDLTIVNVAMPDIMADLGASLDQALWTVSAYALVLAVLLITAGRLGDLYGPRSLFLTGVVVFTLASVVCGLAQSPAELIATRAVQGLGAALMGPQTMALIVSVFPPERRGAAMGVWGSVAGVATISGPTLGGLLVSTAGWRWIFFVNLPIGIAVVVMTLLVVPDIRSGRAHRFDVTGVVLASAALLALCFGLQEGQRYGWNGMIIGCIAAGAVLVAVFLLHQRSRQDREPLLPFAVFRDRNFTLMSLIAGLIAMSMLGLVLPLNLYLQSDLGMSALRAGLTLAPSPLVSMAVAPFAGRMSDRIGGKYVLMFGLVMYGCGIALVSRLAGPDSDWYTFTPALLVTGLGTGCLLAPLAAEAMRGVEPRLAGAASGVNNTIRQLGSVIGSAGIGALMQHELTSQVRSGARTRATALPASARDGFRTAFVADDSRAAGARHVAASVPRELAATAGRLAREVYADGYLAMVHTTMLLPVCALAVGLLACCAATSHTRRAAAGKKPAAPAPADAAVR